MQQGGDYTIPYYSHHQTPTLPNPNAGEFPSNPLPTTYASAPPYTPYPSSSSSSELPPAAFSSPYPPYPQNPDPVPNLPPTAPSYSQSQSKPQTQIPPFQPYNLSPYPSQPETYPHLQQQPVPPSVPYYSHDSNQLAPNYGPPLNPNLNSYNSYESPYESRKLAYDHGSGNGYFNDNSGRYGSEPSVPYGQSHVGGFNQDFYEKKPGGGFQYDQPEPLGDGLGEGVYAYDGGRSELYGSRGTGPARSSSSSSSWSGFDDYGRPKSLSAPGKEQMGGSGKIVRAVPNVEAQQDVKNGVQKFRVKLLPEGSGHSTMDVLCQIGLDGIRMLDPITSRTLRIYPLETITRWEVTDPTVYTFWAKSSVDIEPRRIRLQSSSYTTNTILDTVAAATVQFKEMGGKDGFVRTSDAGMSSEQINEKKKGLVDWMNLMKPGNEEKDHWVPDEAVTKCTSCGTDFSAFVRKHHCRNCGDIFCDKCTHGRIALTADEQAQPVRVCDRCMAEVTQRLSNAKEIASKSLGPHSHEDLARKLQEEMEKNRKPSIGLASSNGSGRRMREVACPTCTVHLQVQVPSSGSETIECGVCQQPFLVSAH